MSRRRILWTLLAVVAALGLAAPAVALVDLASVAASDVAVEQGAAVSADDRARLESAAADLRAAGTPSKFVVLRTRPGDAQGYADSLRERLAFRGDVLVLSPGNLRISSPLRSADVQSAFEAERATLRGDPVAGTIAVARRLADQRAGTGAGSGAPATGDDAGGGGGGALPVILLLVAGAGIVAFIVSRRRARSRAADTGASRRAALEPLVDGLAAQIGDLDDDMAIENDRTLAAREHYDVAVLAYGEARDLLSSHDPAPASVAAAGQALESGLRAARRTRAVLEGRTPEAADEEPLLEGMCAFDPKHGRATTTVVVSTPGGESAELPACAACAADMQAGREPRFREVEERGRMVPYWQSRGMGAGMGMGRGGGLGPVLGGALAGMILSGMLGGADRADAAPDSGSGWGDGGGGGDFGGGDFGGGGGGDF